MNEVNSVKQRIVLGSDCEASMIDDRSFRFVDSTEVVVLLTVSVESLSLEHSYHSYGIFSIDGIASPVFS